jgi:3-oxoacyl-[acyl-carrier-protein] synthase-3
MDINLGCSGYVYGLQQTWGLIQNRIQGQGRALLCCGDISGIMIQDDKTTTPIFSDAISVTALEFDGSKSQPEEISYFNLETMGSGHTAIRSEYDSNNKEVMRLNGIEVFNYSVQFVPKHIKELLAEVPTLPIGVTVLHQANKLINDAIAKRIPLPESAFPSTLFQYGNTASASIPITLVDYLCNQPKENYPKYALLSGFGVGFSMGSAVVPIRSNIYTSNLNFL